MKYSTVFNTHSEFGGHKHGKMLKAKKITEFKMTV